MTQPGKAPDELRQRVEAAQQRNQRRMAGQITDISGTAANAVKEHPFASLATGVAAGILLASLLPKGAKGRGSAMIMGLLADLGTNLAQNAWKRYRSAGQEATQKLGEDTVGEPPKVTGGDGV